VLVTRPRFYRREAPFSSCYFQKQGTNLWESILVRLLHARYTTLPTWTSCALSSHHARRPCDEAPNSARHVRQRYQDDRATSRGRSNRAEQKQVLSSWLVLPGNVLPKALKARTDPAQADKVFLESVWNLAFRGAVLREGGASNRACGQSVGRVYLLDAPWPLPLTPDTAFDRLPPEPPGTDPWDTGRPPCQILHRKDGAGSGL